MSLLPAYPNLPASLREYSFISKEHSPPHFYGRSHFDAARPTPFNPHDPLRALTPPPEMNGMSLAVPRQTLHQNDLGFSNNSYRHDHQTYRTRPQNHRPTIRHSTAWRDGYSLDGANNVDDQLSQRSYSPTRRSSVDTRIDSQPASQRRKSTHVNAIASQYQIPRSVSNSGGSLAELAAQITCLFWFEPAELMEQIENSPFDLPSPALLSIDARPSTGFRKWVTTILATTCVAQNVIILALLFIYRLKKMNPQARGRPGSEYRLLTVALMLGNKFLDDNTYTNKTWAEVSGIAVEEVHTMEVEFLSNIKYNLFTSEEHWAEWQTLLGKFASFFDAASRPRAAVPAPTTYSHHPASLPSPPVSNHASPPYARESTFAGPLPSAQYGPTPAPSPLDLNSYNPTGPVNMSNRKRRHVDEVAAPPAKRVNVQRHDGTPPRPMSTAARQQPQPQPQSMPRMMLPSLPVADPNLSLPPYPPYPVTDQFPSLGYHARTPADVTAYSSRPQETLPHPAYSSAPQQPHQAALRPWSHHPSPNDSVSAPSPAHAIPPFTAAAHPVPQISPTCYLQNRDSPYRPVRGVSTLLHAPNGPMPTRPENVALNQMHYQSLGKPAKLQQSGRLPYVSQNIWIDDHQPHEMTPIQKWPGFPSY